MASPPAGQPTTPTQDELAAMIPTVLELQRLIQDRVNNALRARPAEVAAISCTSCDSQSCNRRPL